MELSRLQLEHYCLKAISLRSNEEAPAATPGTYVNFATAQLGTHVELGLAQLHNGLERHTVTLRVHGGAAEGAVFPYEFEVEYLGFFNGEHLPEESRDDLIAVNGTSMLYGVAREQLLSLTARADKGALLLPSMHFAKLAQQRKDSEPAATARPAQ